MTIAVVPTLSEKPVKSHWLMNNKILPTSEMIGHLNAGRTGLPADENIAFA